MDLSRLLQMLRHERKGQFGLRPDSLLHALKQMMRQGSRLRRNKSLQAVDRPESLEVRQVLSAVSPLESPTPLLVFDETFVDDASVEQRLVVIGQQDVSFPTDITPVDLRPGRHIVEMFRNQLSKSLADGNTIPEMSLSEELVHLPGKASTSWIQSEEVATDENVLSSSIGVSAPEIIDTGLAAPAFSEASEQLNLSFVIEYNDGPQEVIIETISSNDLQIRVSGLAGTIYEVSGADFTAQVFYQNAMAVLQRVQPNRVVQILFPAASLANRERIPTAPGATITDRFHSGSSAGTSSTVAETESGPSVSALLPDLLSKDANTQVAANARQDDSSLIDQIFSVSELTLDTSVLVRLGVASLQQTLAWSQTDSTSVAVRQEEISAAAAELRYEPEAVPYSITKTGSQGGLAKLVRRGLSWFRPGRVPATGLVGDAVVGEFVARVTADLIVDSETEPLSQNTAAEGVEWLSWLFKTSPESYSAIHIGTDNLIRRSELGPAPVPIFSDASSSSRDVRGAWSTQAQIRKYREQHRYASGLNGAACIVLYEQDSSTTPQSTSIPRELKYVANPRGPPVYGRDADVPLLEVDAPADLLERLRYSIAPRGPSLATVETQSPDLTFSSGPRMSPEKMSTDLAI